MSTTHLSRLRSFIGIYSGRYVKWRTPDRDGILVLAEQIKQIKIQIAPQDVSHALTSQWPPSGSCDRFRDLFLYCPPPTQAPVLTVFRICFYLNPTAKNIFECCAPRRGVLFGVFSKNCDYLQYRVFATVAVNGGSVLCRSSFWSGIMLSVGGCYIALGVGGGENYSYIWAQSMVQPCPR